MTGWVILVDQPRDLPNAETPHKVISTSEYLARPRLFDMGRPKLVNLARSYAYQSNSRRPNGSKRSSRAMPKHTSSLNSPSDWKSARRAQRFSSSSRSGSACS